MAKDIINEMASVDVFIRLLLESNSVYLSASRCAVKGNVMTVLLLFTTDVGVSHSTGPIASNVNPSILAFSQVVLPSI